MRSLYSIIEMSYDNFHFENISLRALNENVGEISEFFEYFGHFIREFKFKYNERASVKILEPLLKPIRKYVTEFVNEVHFTFHVHEIEYRIRYPLDESNFTFPNVKVARVDYCRINATTLYQMFPAVRSLDLETCGVSPHLLHLPHLERLKVPNIILPSFKLTLELNPQLRHISITGLDRWELVQALNEIRPDIESLEFSASNLDFQPVVRFARMKVFKWKYSGYFGHQPVPLEFGSLEEIDFNCQELTTYWINVMMENKNLRKITAHFGLIRTYLQRIADELPNLEEFTMAYSRDDFKSVRNIVDFLQRANQLEKATFLNLEQNACDEAAEQVKNEWKNEENGSSCCFVRKLF